MELELPPPSTTTPSGPMDLKGSTPGIGPLIPPGITPSETDAERPSANESERVSTQSPFLLTNPGDSPATVSLPIASNTDVRLSRIDLPTFDGNATKWHGFWDAFSPAIHHNHRIPVAEKFTRLRNLLSGRASRVVAGFSTTANNYQHAVELLFDRFGQSHTIAQSHIQQLVDLPPPRSDYDSLELFYDTAETHIRALDALGHPQDGPSGTLIAPLILNKLPHDARQAITRANKSTDWTLSSLRTLLKQELDARRPPYHNTTSPMETSLFVAPASRNNYDTSQRNCPFCSGNHSPNLCEIICDVTRRKQIIAEKRLCFNCLAKGHSLKDCRSRGRCLKCKRKHHTTICQAAAAIVNIAHGDQHSHSVEQSSISLGPESSSTDDNVTHQNVMSQDFSSTPSLLLPSDNNGILFQTATAPVLVNYGNKQIARILFDTGAQRTLVSQSFADKVNAASKGHESIAISGIEDRYHSERRIHKVSLDIECRDGSVQSIDALVLSTITASLRSKNNQVHRYKYLAELPLAHPKNTDERFEVDILIGSDYYWEFVEDEIIRGEGPTAMKSRVGYLLSGPLSKENIA